MSEEPGIKVTDKRMFDADGELREEYRFLEDETRRQKAPEPPAEPPAGREGPAGPSPLDPRAPDPRSGPAPGASATAPDPGAGRPAVEIPSPTPGPGAGPQAGGGPSFFDLLAVLAEPVAFYLGDQPLPDGETREDLQAARVYIDLLDVLRQKTAGNLSAQEANVLEDLLYRLRLRYVEKRG